MIEEVYVTNNSDKDLYSEYNFVGFDFPVGKTVKVPVSAARHMLGYGDENKEPYLVLLGLIRLHSELEDAMEKFEKVEISETPPEKNRSLPSAVGVVALHVERRVERNVTKRTA
jgi:hypothetical protein